MSNSSSGSNNGGGCIGRLCGEKIKVADAQKFAFYAAERCGKVCAKDSRMCKTCVGRARKGGPTYHGRMGYENIPNTSHILGSKKTLQELSRLGMTMANLEDRAAAAEKIAAKAARNAEEAAKALAEAKAAKAEAKAAKAEATAAKKAAKRVTLKIANSAEKAANSAEKAATSAKKAANTAEKAASNASASERKTRKRAAAAKNNYAMFNPFDPRATNVEPSPEGVAAIREKLPGYGVYGIRQDKKGRITAKYKPKPNSEPNAGPSSVNSVGSAFSVSPVLAAAPAPAPVRMAMARSPSSSNSVGSGPARAITPVGGAGGAPKAGATEPSMENLLEELGLEQTELA